MLYGPAVYPGIWSYSTVVQLYGPAVRPDVWLYSTVVQLYGIAAQLYGLYSGVP